MKNFDLWMSISGSLLIAAPIQAQKKAKEKQPNVNQSLHRFFLVGAVCNEVDGSPLDNAQREHTQQALGVHSALVLLHPNGALELVGFLDEKRGRSRMQADLVVHDCLFHIHSVFPPRCIRILRTIEYQIYPKPSMTKYTN